jgi:hypothetical protein
MVDPNGKCGRTSLSEPAGLSIDPNGQPRPNAGLMIDPDGSSVEPNNQPLADQGLMIDPNG